MIDKNGIKRALRKVESVSVRGKTYISLDGALEAVDTESEEEKAGDDGRQQTGLARPTSVGKPNG